ncbi:hypothetical protein DFH07DRAFT_703847, partial [Mycena maculata]
IVLQAGDRIFRVAGSLAGSILAARSTVFQDMLSIPQPESQPLIVGCPIVVLHDSPDAEYFLRAVFDSDLSLSCSFHASFSPILASFFERPPARTTFAILSGVLRLGIKYDVAYLRRRALLHL